MSFLVGSDPEIVLINKDKKHISAIGKVGGSKENPKATKHGFVQEDNVLVEFNTKPAGTAQEFLRNSLDMLQDIDELIVPLDLSICIKSSALFEDDQLDHFLAQLAGCTPDFNAWNGEINEAPDLASTNMRTAGGHLHISFDSGSDMQKRYDMIKAMDLVAGVPSVLMDSDVDRRSLYGKAGACRPKFVEAGDAYDGAEYRTLSNFWLGSEQRIVWAFNAVDRVMSEFDSLVKAANVHSNAITQCINQSNKALAEKLVKTFRLEVA